MSRRARFISAALAWPAIDSLLSPLARERALILKIHRLQDPERGVRGRDPQRFREVLAYLRKKRCELLPLDELIQRLRGEGPPPRHAVAVTIDDGYAEQALIGAPLFAEFDCPVTTFVTTGFLDGRLWFWWDKIEYVFRKTRRRELRTVLGDTEPCYSLDQPESREIACKDFAERCKGVPDRAKQEAIERLGLAAEVEIPEDPPPEYEPMSWNQLRDCETRGMTFGPHTVTHPILSQTSAAVSKSEITGSWERLRSEARRPVPVFAYPNGRWRDFGQREIDTLKAESFLGAVATSTGYNTRSALRADPDARFKLHRFGNADSLSNVAQLVTGFYRLKRLIPGRA